MSQNLSKSPDLTERPKRNPKWFWADHPNNKPGRGTANAENAAPEVNLPDRSESHVLKDGEKKVEEKLDTRMPNSSIFTLNKEDHTLGNLIRDKLISNSHVTFVGHKVPHPLVPKVEIHLKTDGAINPKEALLAACKDLMFELDSFSREFTKEYELRKMVSGGGGQNAQ